MRLIDADALKEVIPDTCIYDMSGDCRNCTLLLPNEILDIIDEAPTIERPTRSQFKRMAVQLGYEPVVHCKDCKHRDPEDERCDCGCWHTPFTTNDNDFCSYGERRENR